MAGQPHLFCRISFDSGGRFRRSFDMSRGWWRVEGEGRGCEGV